MTWTRTTTLSIAALLLVGLLGYGFWPAATPVTTATVTRDSMRVTIEEEGRTRLEERYVVSAPATGYLKRVPGEVGDSVRAGEVLARLATRPSPVLSQRRHRTGEATVAAARAALQQVQAQAEGARATLTHAKEEYRRVQRLHEEGTASAQQLDRAQMEFEQAKAEHRAAQKSIAQARHELEKAKRRVTRSTVSAEGRSARVSLRAPTDGQILKVHRTSAGIVQAGTPLFAVGRPDSLEVVVDVLSTDAARISPGMPVEIVRWGGDEPLAGRVQTVSPRGQTEVSALGVEEQRVPVRVALTEAPSDTASLGTGYRVVARFIPWAGADVLQVPQSALFRHEGDWAVFVVRDGTAERQPVDVGHRSGLRAQITDGLSADATVITHPGDDLADGTRVEAR